MSLGSRPAEESILHLLLELWCRLMLIGEAGDTGFQMHLTQEQLGNVLGMSLVHTNKTLKKLRDEGLVTISNDRHYAFPEIREVIRRADFDATFLEAFRTTALVVSRDDSANKQIEAIIETARSIAQDAVAPA